MTINRSKSLLEFSTFRTPLPIADEKPQNVINIKSFDYDRCIGKFKKDAKSDSTSQAPGQHSREAFRKANKDLIESIIQEAREEKYEKLFLMIGSYRQSKEIDDWNTEKNKNGSCFRYTRYLREFIQDKGVACELDKFLLADLLSDSFGGERLINALLSPSDKEILQTQPYDSTKFVLLYTQIHRSAMRLKYVFKTDAKITFDFYDDRDDILMGLNDLFRTKKYLLPDNVTLRLHQYYGGPIITLKEIKGTGSIDENYVNNAIHFNQFLSQYPHVDPVRVTPLLQINKLVEMLDRIDIFEQNTFMSKSFWNQTERKLYNDGLMARKAWLDKQTNADSKNEEVHRLQVLIEKRQQEIKIANQKALQKENILTRLEHLKKTLETIEETLTKSSPFGMFHPTSVKNQPLEKFIQLFLGTIDDKFKKKEIEKLRSHPSTLALLMDKTVTSYLPMRVRIQIEKVFHEPVKLVIPVKTRR